MPRFTYLIANVQTISGGVFAYVGDPTTLNDCDILVYVNARSRWENAPVSSIPLIHSLFTKNASYPLTSTDDTIIVAAVGAAIDITLPTAIGVTGKTYTVKRTDATIHIVRLITSGGQTIDGEATQTLQRWDSITVISDGSNWFII
jgi:hypothetical protein